MLPLFRLMWNRNSSKEQTRINIIHMAFSDIKVSEAGEYLIEEPPLSTTQFGLYMERVSIARIARA